MIDEELVKELYEIQQKKKCLMVFDDIWSKDFLGYSWCCIPSREYRVQNFAYNTQARDCSAHGSK